MAIFAFYVTEFPAGGTGTAVLHTAEELVCAGHQVFVYTARHLVDQYPKACSRCVHVVTVPTADPDTNENIDFLCHHLASNGVSVLVVVAMHFLRMRTIKERISCHLIYALHGVPFYEACDVATNKRLEAARPGKWGRFLAYWFFHHWRYKWLGAGLKKVLPIYREMFDSSDSFVVLCDDYARFITKKLRLSDAERRKLRVIPNGIVLKEVSLAGKEKIILFVGRLTFADKRPMRLVEIWSRVWRQLPSWTFVVVGDGPERTLMEKRVASLGVERMVFQGFSNDVDAFYRRASIICLTSQYEGWGLCLAEGQAQGVVPIAFDCSAGVRDIISEPWSNGVLVSSYNCRIFAQCLYKLASDEAKLDRMKHTVVEKAKTYDMRRNSEGYRRLLEELV